MEKIAILVRYKDIGIISLEDRQYSQFIGALAQNSPLIDWKDGKGSTLEGRLPLPCIMDMLGSKSFDQGCSTHWEAIHSGIREEEYMATSL